MISTVRSCGPTQKLVEDWPVDGDLVVPIEAMPPQMIEGMGESWRDRQSYKKHISELTDE